MTLTVLDFGLYDTSASEENQCIIYEFFKSFLRFRRIDYPAVYYVNRYETPYGTGSVSVLTEALNDNTEIGGHESVDSEADVSPEAENQENLPSEAV